MSCVVNEANLAPTVQKVDSAIQWIVQLASLILIYWIKIYPMDSAIQRLNNRRKVDKSSQPTHKKDPTGRIEMFAVPVKITSTKPLNKATPKRITLTPVSAISNPANQVTVQQVTSTAPDTAKNTAFMPAQKQINVGSSPVNAMENQITPRRVPLMPAINSQPKKNNTCGQVTPRRVPLTS